MTLQPFGTKVKEKKSNWQKLPKAATAIAIISLLITAFFGYQNFILNSQSYSLNQQNYKMQNYPPSLYSYYGTSQLDKSISISTDNLVTFYGNVNFNLDISAPHNSIVTINEVSLNFSYGDAMGTLDLSLENHSYAILYGRTSYQYTVSPSSPKVSDNAYVKVNVYLTPKNYSEFPTTINFNIGELVFKATITERINNQTTYTQFTEGIRGQVEFFA